MNHNTKTRVEFKSSKLPKEVRTRKQAREVVKGLPKSHQQHIAEIYGDASFEETVEHADYYNRTERQIGKLREQLYVATVNEYLDNKGKI